MLAKLWSAAFASAYLVSSALCDCESYGIDFQNGGTYFQNSLSTDPFTALQTFEGCQNDTAHNVFVTPEGDQSECSMTPMTPDDTPELITCTDWPKDKLYNGEWSMIIVSNNGDGDPIAYQRDFSLTVGPQQTVTLPVTTITGGSAGTRTVTPRPVTTTVLVGIFQFTNIVRTTATSSATAVVAASCSITPTSSHRDARATIIPSILGNLNSVASSIINGGRKRSEPTPVPLLAKFKRDIIEGRSPERDVKAAFIEARKASLQKLGKRDVDLPTITSTPAPVYVQATTTIPGVTRTNSFYLPFVITTITETTTTTSTRTIKTVASGASASCSSAGGTLV